jgi:hypothetical protein
MGAVEPGARDGGRRHFLADAGFTVEARYGGWLREPFEPAASREIVTVARVGPNA